MDDTAIVLDGYLDDQTLPDDLHGTRACFQLVVSPTDDRIDELVMPCHVVDPELAHAVLHDLGAGDLLRVTGELHLPRTPGDGLRLHVTDITVLETGPDLAHADTDQDLAPEALPDHGLLERHGDYQVWHDPDTGRSSVWHTSGEWAGTTDDPTALTDVITAHAQRTQQPPTQQ
ncbi:hypothetical protein GCM10010377_68730 [Streptomyces viridiviolaceus]|uniref:OB-fold nucleic acid binding domain-containing protein n=1 Tax=Streptomyces viridiviolaceus TaxID=68282 RepID=A0ABW2E7A0_9ACTN|nr:OB-fold nucleic acid binding domain-containing protein [Streptomyces viridiviolaceus]GHB68068.1 hypothetical protein GCM10010377_68730 [Streptomyces viridiviolaceus]